MITDPGRLWWNLMGASINAALSGFLFVILKETFFLTIFE
jgi:hypothetical protein